MRGIVEKTESGYARVQTDLVEMRRAGDLSYGCLADIRAGSASRGPSTASRKRLRIRPVSIARRCGTTLSDRAVARADDMTGILDIVRPATGGGINCIAFKPYDSGGVVRGWADLQIIGWHFRILGCPASSHGERRWVGLPGKPMTDRDGQPLRDEGGKARYVAFAAFDDKDLLHRFFSDAAVRALDLYAPGWDRP